MKEKYDLGKGNLWSLTLRLAIPTALGQAVSVLYAIIDRMFIGHIPGYGELALAGVGVAAPIVTMITSFSAMVGMGGAPLMAMREGHQEHSAAESILFCGFVMLLAISAAITPLALLSRNFLLSLFGASSATMEYASSYLGIYLVGTPFAMLASGLNSYVISQGLSGKGMASVLIGAALNLILDPIFIFALDMGVKGAAIATVISQIASSALTIAFLLIPSASIRLRPYAVSGRTVRLICKYGFSPFLIIATDNLILIVLNTMLQKYGGPELGDKLITASAIIQSFHLLVMNPIGGITGGCQGLISFNYGAGNTERVRQGIRKVQITATAYTAVMTLITVFGARQFAACFTSSPEIQELTARYMVVFEAAIIPISFQYCNIDCFTAIGQVRYALPLSLFRKSLFIVSAMILPMFFGAPAAFLSEPISDLIAGITSTSMMWTKLPSILRRREKSGLVI